MAKTRAVILAIVGGVLLVAAIAALVAISRSEPTDPTALPRRTLRIVKARVSPAPASLLVKGTTNLVDRAVLQIHVRSGKDTLLTRTCEVAGGEFSYEEPAQGALSPGKYEVEVRFELAAQSKTVAEALGFQPSSLSDRAELETPATYSAEGASTPRSRVLELVDRVSQAKPEQLDELDQEAAELSGKLWIAEEKAALKSLRLAVAEAKKTRPDRQAFERLLLKAHTQASSPR